MANKKIRQKKPASVLNRRASFDYDLGDELTVGIVLTGVETRAARDGHVQLKGSYVNIKDNELWLNNASFSLKINEKNQPNRTVDLTPRKLLASKKQIESLAKNRQAGYTIVPIKLLTGGRYIKLIIALGKGKKKYDKRETLKRKQASREASRIIKNR